MTTDEKTLDAIGRIIGNHFPRYEKKSNFGLIECLCGWKADGLHKKKAWQGHVAESLLKDGVLLTPEEYQRELTEAVSAAVLKECEQAEARVQAAVAAVLERAVEHWPIWGQSPNGEMWLSKCSCGEILINKNDWQQHILSLAPTDALREVKAQERLEEARWWRSRWFDKFECVENLDRRIAELQQAVDKGKEEQGD